MIQYFEAFESGEYLLAVWGVTTLATCQCAWELFLIYPVITYTVKAYH
jgi:hypothetical protein